MSDNTDTVWVQAEALGLRLQVVEIMTSLFPRCDLANELEPGEITAILDHLNGLVAGARQEVLVIMRRDLARHRKELKGGAA